MADGPGQTGSGYARHAQTLLTWVWRLAVVGLLVGIMLQRENHRRAEHRDAIDLISHAAAIYSRLN